MEVGYRVGQAVYGRVDRQRVCGEKSSQGVGCLLEVYEEREG